MRVIISFFCSFRVAMGDSECAWREVVRADDVVKDHSLPRTLTHIFHSLLHFLSYSRPLSFTLFRALLFHSLPGHQVLRKDLISPMMWPKFSEHMAAAEICTEFADLDKCRARFPEATTISFWTGKPGC